MALVVKNPPTYAGDIRDVGSIPGSGRYLGGGNGNPLQHSCLKNRMDRGVRQATVHRVAKSRTRLKRLSMHTCMYHIYNIHYALLIFTLIYVSIATSTNYHLQ